MSLMVPFHQQGMGTIDFQHWTTNGKRLSFYAILGWIEMNICSSCFALEGWNTAGPLGPSWWPHPVSQETNYSMSLWFRQHFLDSMWDKIISLGKNAKMQTGGPLSVMKVLRVDYGVVLGPPIVHEGLVSRFKVQEPSLLLWSSTNFVWRSIWPHMTTIALGSPVLYWLCVFLSH